MRGKFYKIIGVLVFLLLISPAALALDEDEVDVTVEVEPYAEIHPGSIAGDEWMPGTIEEGEEGPKGTFSGEPGETRWAQTELVVNTNTDVDIELDIESFPHEGLEDKMYKIEVESIEEGSEYVYRGGSGATWEEIFVGGEAGSDANLFNINVEATMPEEFWEIEAGDYMGTIDVIVSAK